MKPRLISSKLCPYAQRCAIALIQKGIEHDIEYIDLNAPPDWFGDVSPLKKVPALIVDDDHAFFGSSVINEYLEESYPNPLHPSCALHRASNRSWIEFSSECVSDLAKLMLSKDEGSVLAARAALQQKFDQLESILGDGPYFNGETFSQVDVAFAPLFQRLNYLEGIWPGINDLKRHPRVAAWSRAVLAVESVLESTVPDLHPRFFEFIKRKEGFLSKYM